MIPFPNIDPVIFRIGPLVFRWYGMMYLFGFGSSFLLIKYRLNLERKVLKDEQIEDLFFLLVLGLILGARIGYMLFYDFEEAVSNPLSIVAVWKGGMSFHGGLLGASAAGIWFCRKHGVPALALADIVMITAPIGLGFGRLGNFINGELWGRITGLPWGMVFPHAGSLPRHPSQLYELGLEGIILFIVMWSARHRLKKPGQMTALFLICYGFFRIIAEFFREPDPQLGFLFGFITMGQLLSSLMIICGSWIMFIISGNDRVKRRN